MNDKAGARTPLALVFASITLALCLLVLTGLLTNLPKSVLAAVVLAAVVGLIDFPALFRMFRVSKMDFYAAITALGGVLLLGILQGILLAAAVSVLILLFRANATSCGFSGPDPRHKQLLGYCPPSLERAVSRHHCLSSRSVAALCQCRIFSNHGSRPYRD